MLTNFNLYYKGFFMAKYCAAFCLLVLCLASCSKDSTVAPPTSTTGELPPKVGSTFTYDHYDTDTTTGLPIAAGRETTVQTVIKTGMTYFGRNNVMMLVEPRAGRTDTTYMTYDSTAGLSMFHPNLSGSTGKWLAHNVASNLIDRIDWMDTSYQDNKIFGVHSFTLATSTAVQDSMLYKGNMLKVIKILKIYSHLYNTGTYVEIESIKSYIYYAPSIGNFVKIELPVHTILKKTTIEDTIKVPGKVSVLVDHSLK